MTGDHVFRHQVPDVTRCLPDFDSPPDPEGLPSDWNEYAEMRCTRCGQVLLVRVWRCTDPESGHWEDYEDSVPEALLDPVNEGVPKGGCDPDEATVWRVMMS